MQTIETAPRRVGGRVTLLAAAAAAIAAPAEGLHQVAYRDPPGILTACYGDTHNIDPRHIYSIAECKARLATEMTASVEQVLRCAPGAPDRVVIAFSDAVYNLGPAIACSRNASTAARFLYAHDWAGACAQLPRWDKAVVLHVSVSLPGLTKRRALEESVCEGRA